MILCDEEGMLARHFIIHDACLSGRAPDRAQLLPRRPRVATLLASVCVLLRSYPGLLIGAAGGGGEISDAQRGPAAASAPPQLRLRGGGLIKKKSKAGHAVRKAKKRGLWYARGEAHGARRSGVVACAAATPSSACCP